MVVSPVMRGLIVISLPILFASGGRVSVTEESSAITLTDIAAIPVFAREAVEALEAPLKMGRVKEANESLIPSMVPPSGLEYQFQVTGLRMHTIYHLHKISSIDAATPFVHPLALLDVKVSANSLSFGHKSHHVLSKTTGEEIFKIRSSRSSMNPFFSRQSFRILPPGSKDNNDALFTVNQENAGSCGNLITNPSCTDQEFIVYRGRERDSDPVLYAVGQFPRVWWPNQAAGAGGFTFYEDKSKSKVLAKIEQNPKLGTFTYTQDSMIWTIIVQPGVDSALILSCATIFGLSQVQDGR